MTSDVATPPDAAPLEPAPRPTTRTSTAIGTYRPGLDGMRGLAMLFMLGYHGEIAWCRGAFLALSQFFTLSGFLITGVLLRNHLRPGGEMTSFWTRRVRRLMPAAILALIGIVIYGATVATRQQADALPGDVFAAATWTANWHFILSGQSYLNLFAAPSPVQHFWSLAIEEQFYLVLPVVMILVIRRTRSLRVLLAVLGTAALLSTAWMIALYQGGASLDRLYYGTDTRMAELLVGAALAVVLFRTGVEFSERLRRIFGVVGLLCFVATLWCWTNISLADGPIWRGGFLAYSFLSCGVILGVLAGKAPLTTILSFRPIVYVGRISYGVYLFHWPVYLWLDQARTGLDGWALLSLRLAVTFALAILSFRLVEQPIMRGRSFGLRGRGLLLAVPCVLAVIVVLSFVTVNRSGADPLATLRGGGASAMPRTAGDGVLDVLVIPPSADDPVVGRLRDSLRGDASVQLTVAPPLRCDGGLVDTPHGRTCANWARTWPALIARDDPDAVVVYADDWAGDDIGKLTGAPPSGAAAAAAPILNAGLDLLTTKGAPVVWGTSGSNFGIAIQRSLRPLGQAMTQLRSTRTDLYKVLGMPDPATLSRSQYLAQSAKTLLDSASLYQRRAADGLPKVMIVGDSQSESLGYGLERWTAEQHRALVWNRGAEGCGVVVAGAIHTFGSTGSGMEKCRTASEAWTPDLRSFDPAAVVVLTSITDVQDRKLPGSDTFNSIGQPQFDRFLVRQYEHVIDTLSATGAKVVWLKPPCAAIPSGLGQQAVYDSSEVEHLNSVILPRVERARAGKVTMFDLDGVICPGGKVRESVPGVGALRPDGVHFSVPGALWFARTNGERLLRAAGI